MVTAAGGDGIACVTDHLDPDQVGALVARIDGDHGRLDILVNDIWGGDDLVEWGKKLWEIKLEDGLTLIDRALKTHIITSHYGLPRLREGGLVAPAINVVDRRSLDEVMAALNDLVRRVRAGRLRGSERTDPTITVTNLGDRGVESVFGVITPPQVALVGAGRIEPRPWAVGTTVEVRRVLHLTLAADHRASDGHTGALFLATIARHLERPETL